MDEQWEPLSARELRARVEDLEAEVERLRGVFASARVGFNAEVERLEAELAKWRYENEELSGVNRELGRQSREAEADVERLREALEHVRDKSATLGDASHRARAALASLEGENA